MSYIDKFDPDEQIDAEEWIASVLYDTHDSDSHSGSACEADQICEESAGYFGRVILHEILSRFRPDLIAEEEA